MNEVKVRFIVDTAYIKKGTEKLVSPFVAKAMVRDGLAVIVE